MLRALVSALAALFRTRTDLIVENLALRGQLAGLQNRKPRHRLAAGERIFWVALRDPVNIPAKSTSPPVTELQQLGVARLSVGGLVSLAALALFRRAAEELRDKGTYGFTEGALVHAEMNALLWSPTGSNQRLLRRAAAQPV